MGWMVIIGHRLLRAPSVPIREPMWSPWCSCAFDLKTESWCLLFALQNQVANASPCFPREHALIIWMNLNMKCSTFKTKKQKNGHWIPFLQLKCTKTAATNICRWHWWSKLGWPRIGRHPATVVTGPSHVSEITHKMMVMKLKMECCWTVFHWFWNTTSLVGERGGSVGVGVGVGELVL